MRIQLNGEPRDLDGPLSIAALLEQLQVNPQLVAVEYNLRVIRRARYADTMIEEGAEVEVVNFVGGGAGSPPWPGAFPATRTAR
jgi:thiamine biosynthesis protein ThiS